MYAKYVILSYSNFKQKDVSKIDNTNQQQF